jgi:hypothetical protein
MKYLSNLTRLFYGLESCCQTIFQPKGSSFNDDNKEFIRFELGKDLFIPAFEEAVKTMHVSPAKTSD